jgi:transposase-like protein
MTSMGTESGLRRQVAGLSEAEFRARFGSEAQCRAALFALRWGKGWQCPACGHGRCAELKTRALYSCHRCKHQVGLTAGTVFHWTKLPLTTWFLAIYHLTQSKGGMSSVELARRLGTRQPTAWLMKQKLMAAMQARDAGKPKLAGRVEVDDAYLGGQRSGGKRGRGAAGKTPFVAAVETTADRKPRRLRLTVVKGFRKKEIEALAKRDFAAGSNIVSDGLSCWTAVTAAGCDHFPMITGGGPQAAKWAPFKWVNTTLGNIKTALAGTYHHVSPKHAQRYLASFAWRFNRRFQLDTMTERLVYACARTAPHPYRVIIVG